MPNDSNPLNVKTDASAILRALLETAPDAIFVKDAQGHYLLANRRTEEALSVGPGGAHGLTAADCFSPEIAKAIQSSDELAIATRSAVRTDDVIQLNGETRIFDSVKIPFEKEDEVVGVIGISRDVTEQRALLRRIEEGERKLRTIFETLPECVKIVSPDGELLDMNDAGLAMIEFDSLEEARRASIADLILPPWRKDYEKAHRTALAGNAAEPIRIEFMGRKGRRRIVEMRAVPLTEPDGTVAAVLSITSDITDAVAAQEQLQSLQSELIHIGRVSAMGTMAVTLAHELNQPLAAIANYTAGLRRLIANAGFDGDAIVAAIDAIAESSMRASEVIRRVRTMTRRSEAHWEEIEVKALVVESVRLVAMGSWPDVSVSYDFAPDARVLGDPVQLQQVLLNLLRNGVEAYRDGQDRSLRITSIANADKVVIRVEDCGCGIDEEAMKFLFEPFTSTTSRGMGVGLSICRTIVEAHNGRIWAEQNPGGGTIMAFELPSAAKAEADRAIPE